MFLVKIIGFFIYVVTFFLMLCPYFLSKLRRCLFRNICDVKNLLHKEFRLTKFKHSIAIPLSFKSAHMNMDDILGGVCPFCIEFIDSKTLLNSKVKKPSEQLVALCLQYIVKANISSFDVLKEDLPKRWDIHGDLILFPENSFSLQIWENFPEDFWTKVAKIFNVNRIATKSKISSDFFRTPNVILRHGNGNQVEHIDNGIKYAYDVTLNMFSKGNITEKLRISAFNCENEVVVDMFAGYLKINL